MNHTPKRCNFVLNLQLFFPVFSWLSFCQPTGVAWNCCVNGWQRSDLSRWCIAARQCGRTSVGSQDGALAVALPYGRMQIDQLHNDSVFFFLLPYLICRLLPGSVPESIQDCSPPPPHPMPPFVLKLLSTWWKCWSQKRALSTWPQGHSAYSLGLTLWKVTASGGPPIASLCWCSHMLFIILAPLLWTVWQCRCSHWMATWWMDCFKKIFFLEYSCPKVLFIYLFLKLGLVLSVAISFHCDLLSLNDGKILFYHQNIVLKILPLKFWLA